jgi:glycosyltransferase involved in cell wall biosynthesis
VRVLIAIFFPRSIHLEGVHTLIDSLATSLVTRGIETTVLAPLGTGSAGTPYMVIDYLRKTKSGAGTLLRQFAKALNENSRLFDIVQLVDVSPSFLPFTERMVSRPERTLDLIVGPALTWGDLRGRRFSRQLLGHWISKNAGWARLAQGRCRKYIVSSQFQRQQLISLGLLPDRVSIVPFGIHPLRVRHCSQNLARQALGIKGEQVIGYIGHFSSLKGVPDLLDAFEKLALSRPGVQLILAWSGKGNESKRVLGQIQSSSVRNQIQLLGRVDVAQFMASCDVLALPYLGSSIPHFPLVLLEAFGSRTPVVTTDVGGVPEAVVDGTTGMLASPGNPAELASALAQVLGDEPLRQQIIAQAERAFRESFDSTVVSGRFIDLYQEALA